VRTPQVVGFLDIDCDEIAKVTADHGLYEEAQTIYKKYDRDWMAINILVKHIVSIDCGFDYAYVYGMST
jgi:clathrin heavy chain